MNRRALFGLVIGFCGLVADGGEPPARLVCVGRVEPVDGEIEVAAQMSGTLISVPVKEGDWVAKGDLLAEVDGRREKAALDLAAAKLGRVKAGNGAEEIAAAEANRDAVAAALVFAESEYKRAVELKERTVISADILEERLQRVASLRKQLVSAGKQLEAQQRGPLPEDIALAEAELAAARTAYELRLVRAEKDGAILTLLKHTGDFVSQSFPSAILRLANTRQLRIRIEVNEQDVNRVQAGLQGEFTTYGADKPGGQLVIRTVLPAYAPRRLFEPDSTVRLDTRTLEALCEVAPGSGPVMSGQRVKAAFILSGH